MTIALFETYPRLAEQLPRIALCQLPTPVQQLRSLEGVNAYVKRDDVSAPVFGGNKVRALEFLLGAAQQRRTPRAVVMGLPGTSMALASAIYGKQQKLNLAVVLVAQRPTEEARRNLLIFQQLGSELHTVASLPEMSRKLIRLMLGGLISYRKLPYILNPGSVTGMTGYVNMAFELRDQIRQGQLPEPDRLYIAMGLRGTSTGLLLGLRAAGLKTRLVAVSHEPHDAQGILKTKRMMIDNAKKLNTFLSERAPDFPDVNLQIDDFDIACDGPGQKETTLTSEGVPQIEEIWQQEGIQLDATWSALTWAAMQRDLKSKQAKTPLLWHTYNTQPTPLSIDGVDYHKLPPAFHRYFEEPVVLQNKPIFAKD